MRKLALILFLFISFSGLSQEERFSSSSLYFGANNIVSHIDPLHSWSLWGGMSFNQNDRKGIRIDASWLHNWSDKSAVRANHNDVTLSRKWYWTIEKVNWLGLELNAGISAGRQVLFYDYLEGSINRGFNHIGIGPSLELAPSFKINDRLSVFTRIGIKSYFGIEREFLEFAPFDRTYLQDDFSVYWFAPSGVGLKFDLNKSPGDKSAINKNHLIYFGLRSWTALLLSTNSSYTNLSYAYMFNGNWGIKGTYQQERWFVNGYNWVRTSVDNWYAGVMVLRSFNFEGKKLGKYFSLESNLGVILGRKQKFIEDSIEDQTSIDIFDGLGPTLSLIPTFQFSNWGALYFDFNAHCLLGEEFDNNSSPPGFVFSQRFGYSTGSVGFRLGL